MTALLSLVFTDCSHTISPHLLHKRSPCSCSLQILSSRQHEHVGCLAHVVLRPSLQVDDEKSAE